MELDLIWFAIAQHAVERAAQRLANLQAAADAAKCSVILDLPKPHLVGGMVESAAEAEEAWGSRFLHHAQPHQYHRIPASLWPAGYEVVRGGLVGAAGEGRGE